MLLRIPPRALAERNLVIRAFAGEDHVAEVMDLRAGWILSASAAPGPFWWWSLTGPSCALARVSKDGRCGTLDEAKARLSSAYGKWLQWALAQPHDVSWFNSHAPIWLASV